MVRTDLIEVATESTAELIVIGVRRRTPVGNLIMGSNAQQILPDAGCPVLPVNAGVRTGSVSALVGESLVGDPVIRWPRP